MVMFNVLHEIRFRDAAAHRKLLEFAMAHLGDTVSILPSGWPQMVGRVVEVDIEGGLLVLSVVADRGDC